MAGLMFKVQSLKFKACLPMAGSKFNVSSEYGRQTPNPKYHSMSTLKPKIRIEFEKSISPTHPKDLLKQKLIMNDMGFYQRVLSHKITEVVDMDLIKDDDTIVIRYGLDGERLVDVQYLNPTIAQGVKSIAEGVFPINYINAKK